MAELSIPYPTDTSGWEEWQLEYRFGGFYVFPPEEIIEEVDGLRERYDPISHRACQAHVSLSEPVPRALGADDVAELRRVLGKVAPFVIRYGDVHSTTPYPGVVYRIEPTEAFAGLRSAVHSSALFRASPLSRRDVPPHMTVAEFISLDESIALAQRLRGTVREGEWVCQEIEYAVPDYSLRFRRVLRVPLSG